VPLGGEVEILAVTSCDMDAPEYVPKSSLRSGMGSAGEVSATPMTTADSGAVRTVTVKVTGAEPCAITLATSSLATRTTSRSGRYPSLQGHTGQSASGDDGLGPSSRRRDHSRPYGACGLPVRPCRIGYGHFGRRTSKG
jgi:hypothetical protein